jgi:hypothetical protein
MIRAILASAVLALGVNAMAATPSTTAPAAATGTATTTATTTTTTQTETKMVPGKKMAANGAYAKAKEECLAKDSTLKGKELRKCIKEKKAATTPAAPATK